MPVTRLSQESKQFSGSNQCLSVEKASKSKLVIYDGQFTRQSRDCPKKASSYLGSKGWIAHALQLRQSILAPHLSLGVATKCTIVERPKGLYAHCVATASRHGIFWAIEWSTLNYAKSKKASIENKTPLLIVLKRQTWTEQARDPSITWV